MAGYGFSTLDGPLDADLSQERPKSENGTKTAGHSSEIARRFLCQRQMLTLDRSRNDTSVALDFLRAMAAQFVCIGHAINLSEIWWTGLPPVGVLLFFVISGFVIAHTLSSKTAADQAYGLVSFGIERFARIYTPYLPAMLLIEAIEVATALPIDWPKFLGRS